MSEETKNENGEFSLASDSQTETGTVAEPAAPAKPQTMSQLLAEVREEAAPAKKPKTPKKPKADKPAASSVPAAETPKEKKLAAPTIDIFKLPTPELEDVSLSALTFDRRLQHRKEIRNDAAVKHYAEAMADGAAFPPIRVVRERAEGDGKDTLWVWDGFQRGGAYESNKTKVATVEVTEGTFKDALLLSFGSNGENSVLPRTSDDARRSVLALLDDPETLALVIESGKGNGGVHRAIVAACKCSSGTVTNALNERGLKASGGKLIKAPKKKEDEEKKDEGKKDETGTSPELAPVKPAPVGTVVDPKKDAEIYQMMLNVSLVDRLAEARKCARRIGALYSTLIEDPTFGPYVRQIMQDSGYGIPDEYDARKAKQGKDFAPHYEIMELWTPVPSLCELTDRVKAVIEEVRRTTQDAADKQKALATGVTMPIPGTK